MRYALAILGFAALAIAAFIAGGQGADFMITILVGCVVAAAVLLTGAVIVSRLDRITRLLKDRARD